MSAPKTDIEKQERRHRGPLIGIAVALLVGAVIALFILFSAMPDEKSSDTGDQEPFSEVGAAAGGE